MRRKILKNQRSHNFQNEYDKIKAMLDHVIIPKGLNPEYYQNRIKSICCRHYSYYYLGISKKKLIIINSYIKKNDI
jgi:hypothetical protein